MGTVYLLHFSGRYRHAAHYIGWTPGELDARLEQHRNGKGARLLAVIAGAGLSFQLARTWSGGRQLERRKKRQGGASKLCPVCKALGQGRKSRAKPKGAVWTGNFSAGIAD